KKETPPRPENCYIIFLRSETPKLEKMTVSDRSKVIRDRWKNAPEHLRAYYYICASVAKKLHAEKFPNYKFTKQKVVNNKLSPSSSKSSELFPGSPPYLISPPPLSPSSSSSSTNSSQYTMSDDSELNPIDLNLCSMNTCYSTNYSQYSPSINSNQLDLTQGHHTSQYTEELMQIESSILNQIDSMLDSSGNFKFLS
ncbi:hypothetical protein C1645_747546, partial [Glomus cerebriforme]